MVRWWGESPWGRASVSMTNSELSPHKGGGGGERRKSVIEKEGKR